MSTSISKSINHPPSGFNPYAPDPASECIVIRGRSISAQSYSPAKTLKMWKPHWWSTFLETEKNVSKVAAFFVLTPYPHPMMNKCEFQRNWGGGGEGGGSSWESSSYTSFHILEWHYPQGNLHFLFCISQRGSCQTTWQTSACQMQAWAPRCIPFKHLHIKWQAWTAGLLASALCFASSKRRVQNLCV